MSRLCLWTAFGDAQPAPLGTAGAARISAVGVGPADASETASDAVLVLPLGAVQGPVAVALVPDALHGAACKHGLPLEAGLHLLRHADRVDLAGWTVWVAGDGVPEEEPYDESAHGADLHCFRTKTRLAPGEVVVRCPGTPGTPCGMVYRADAWRLRLPCHACHYDPRRPAWHPPVPVPRSRLHELVRQVVRARG